MLGNFKVGPTKSGDEAARCCRRSRMWAQCAAPTKLKLVPCCRPYKHYQRRMW